LESSVRSRLPFDHQKPFCDKRIKKRKNCQQIDKIISVNVNGLETILFAKEIYRIKIIFYLRVCDISFDICLFKTPTA
jgi:hypothetical protein